MPEIFYLSAENKRHQFSHSLESSRSHFPNRISEAIIAGFLNRYSTDTIRWVPLNSTVSAKDQARIQTGLHRFTEIGKIFQMTQNRGKYNFRE